MLIMAKISPLHKTTSAAGNGHLECLQLLIDHGANSKYSFVIVHAECVSFSEQFVQYNYVCVL